MNTLQLEIQAGFRVAIMLDSVEAYEPCCVVRNVLLSFVSQERLSMPHNVEVSDLHRFSRRSARLTGYALPIP